LLHVEGGQFTPEYPGQFAPELVVSLRRNQVVWFIRISNLVLLYSGLNRSIKNASYPVKRGRIIQHFQAGNFIQPHTFQVFTRYFNDAKDQNFDLEHWTNKDIAANTNFITAKINTFFNS
jgi:hypothetical protein